MLLSLVFLDPDVSDTILYLLLGTTEPAEIENGEVSVDQTVNQHKVQLKIKLAVPKAQIIHFCCWLTLFMFFFSVAFIKKSSRIL